MKTLNKVVLEFVFILILGFFLFVSIWKSGDQSFTWKLFQLCIATFSSGMLVHSWVRWQILINPYKNNEPNKNSYNGNFTGIIWSFWLTLSLLAWTIFGQDFLWDITTTLSLESTSSSGNTQKIGDSESNSEQLSAYLAGLAIVVAIVTSFYLSMLHSATKYARESAKEARESVTEISENKKEIEKNQKEIENFKHKRSDIDKMVVSYFKFLNQRFLLPMLDDLQFFAIKMGTNDIKEDKIEERIRLLQAEIALFNVMESESCEQFLQRWNDVAAYKDDVFNQYDYSHLFRLARERLEIICQECSQKQLKQIDEIKEFIRSYEQRFSK